jgi:uncharacterized membrane protein (DUF2068 family)
MWYFITVTWAARLLGLWTIYNGVGHTIANILEDKPYDRHFIYLLMIGAILFFSGLMEFISGFGLKNKEWWAITFCSMGCVFVIFLTLILLPVFQAPGMMAMHSALLAMVVVLCFLRRK